MPRVSPGILSFPPFRGLTRQLVLWNLGIYFVLTILGFASPGAVYNIASIFALDPASVLHGRVWQIVTYAFVHAGASLGAIFGMTLEMLSLWFLGSMLEQMRGSRWMGELYFLSVIGAGLAAVVLGLFFSSVGLGFTGCYGALFGFVIAFGVLYGDMEFMMIPFPFMIKAKYMAVVSLIVALAMLFSVLHVFAFSELGGALFGYLYIKFSPRRGFAVAGSETVYGMRNRYYRWRRRRAAKKFEVYMRKHRDN